MFPAHLLGLDVHLAVEAISASGLDDKLTCIASAMPGLPYLPAMVLISYML